MLIQKTNKLLAQVYDRENCTLHYRTLKSLVYLKVTTNNIDYGIIVNKVHNILASNQSSWIKPYILGNNNLIKMLNMILNRLFNVTE